jgi:hypothetical protein
MSSGGRVSVLLLTVVAAVASSGVSAHAAWNYPEDLSAAGHKAFEQAVGMDASGNAVIAWNRTSGSNAVVQVRRRLADGTLTPAQTLSQQGADATSVRIAVASNGDSVVLWRRYDGANFRIQARQRSASGVLGPLLSVSGKDQDAQDPDVDMDQDGNAVMTWSRSDGTNDRVELRTLSAGGTLTPTQLLSIAGEDAVDPHVAVDATGDAIVVWQRSDGTHSRVQARTRSSTGTYGPALTLSPSGFDAQAPRVDMDSAGDAIVGWTLFDGTSDVAQARTRSADGVLTSATTLSDTGVAGSDAESLDVAMDTNGNALVLWDRFNGTKTLVQGRYHPASGGYQGLKTFSRTTQDAIGPHAAFDAAGNAVIVWQILVHQGGSAPDKHRIEAETRSASGTLGPLTDISPVNEDASAPLDVASAPDGFAIAGWIEVDGADSGPSATHWRQVEVATGPSADLTTVAAAPAGPAATAPGAWTAPEDLSPAGIWALEQAVGMDSNGNALIVWIRDRDSAVLARRRLVDGTLTPIQTVGPQGRTLRVAVSSNGDAAIMWLTSDGTNNRVQARRLSASGALGPLLTVSDAGQNAREPDIDMDSAGNAVMTWGRSDGTDYRTELRTLSADGTLTPTQVLSPAGASVFDPRVAVDSDGDAMVVWWGVVPGSSVPYFRVQARTRTAGGTLGERLTLSPPTSSAGGARVDMDPAGDAVIGWIQGSSVAEARTRSAAGVLTSATPLSNSGSGFGSGADSLDLAMDVNGNALIFWTAHSITRRSVQGRYLPAGGTYQGLKELSESQAGVLSEPHAAFDAAGNAVILWRGQPDASGDFVVETRTRAASGALGTVVPLSPSGQDALDPIDIARAPGGLTIASWIQTDGYFGQTQVATGP